MHFVQNRSGNQLAFAKAVLIFLIATLGPASSPAADLLVHPPVPGLETSAHYTVRVRAVGGEWRSAFAWETACKTIEKKTDAYFDTLAGWTLAHVTFETGGLPRPVVQVIAEATGDTLTPRVYAPGKYTVKAGKDKPDTVVAKAVEVA